MKRPIIHEHGITAVEYAMLTFFLGFVVFFSFLFLGIDQGNLFLIMGLFFT